MSILFLGERSHIWTIGCKDICCDDDDDDDDDTDDTDVVDKIIPICFWLLQTQGSCVNH